MELGLEGKGRFKVLHQHICLWVEDNRNRDQIWPVG
jgi:hypothetical protein